MELVVGTRDSGGGAIMPSAADLWKCGVGAAPPASSAPTEHTNLVPPLSHLFRPPNQM
jgi:hypothetical protein